MKQELYHILTAAIATGMLTACSPSPPPGGTIATLPEISKSIKQSNAPLTLVHVWATWCDPCREEFPELMQIAREKQNQGLNLILVSADEPAELESVNRFLQEQQSPIGSLISTELSQEFIELFSPNWAGALPASFFFDEDGRLVEEWQGQRSYEEYIKTIDRLLKKPKE